MASNNAIKNDSALKKRELLKDWYKIVATTNEMAKYVAVLELSDNRNAIADFKRMEIDLRYSQKDFLKKIEKIRTEIERSKK